MSSSYFKKIFRLLREEGLCSFLEKSWNHIARSTIPLQYLFKLRTMKNMFINGIIYESYTNPYQPIYIDPNLGNAVSAKVRKDRGLGQVAGGDWDIHSNTKNLTDYPQYIGLIERYKHGNDWKDTTYYKHAKRKIETSGSRMGYSDIEDFLNTRCQYVDELYENIKKNGYRPNFRGGHNTPEKGSRQKGRRSHRHKLEPLICIGRGGSIFWVEGLHRLAISRILSLDSMPVQVLVRHQQWQKIRDDIYTGEFSSEYRQIRNHPDLQDIID